MLHHPGAAARLDYDSQLKSLEIRGIGIFLELLEECKNAPSMTTAMALERWRGRPEMEALSRLATQESLVSDDAAAAELRDTIAKILGRLTTQAENDPIAGKSRRRDYK